ncbi:MAG: helix-turn-helix domain-containing protein [Paludibacter sp.]|nr:helix-turn-helix domain-containing protein [Paludibacter sp.]
MADDNYLKIEKRLTELISQLEKNNIPDSIQVLENAQLKKHLNVSFKTLQTWRDNGTISYSQIGSKIYYRISDIQELLVKHNRKSSTL